MNQFNSWGQYGFASDYKAAILNYDSNKHTGPTLTLDMFDVTGLVGTILNTVPIFGSNTQNNAPLAGTGINWSELGQKADELLDKTNTIASGIQYYANKYKIANITNSKVFWLIGKATGVVSVINNAQKAYQAFKNGDKAGVLNYGLRAVGQGAAVIIGEEFELGWNLGTLTYDTLFGKKEQ